MRILIDMQGIQSPGSKDRGVGRYTLEMVYAFLEVCMEQEEKHEIFLAFNSSYLDEYERVRRYLGSLINHRNILCWQQNFSDVSGRYGAPGDRHVAELIREWFIGQLGPDIVWSTNLQEGWQDNCVTSVKKIFTDAFFVSTVHDVIPLLYPNIYLSSSISEWYKEKIAYAKRSDLILTVSEFSKKCMVDLLGIDNENILVAHNGISSFAEKASSIGRSDAVEKYVSMAFQPYLLYVGGFDSHKNVDVLVKGFSKVVSDSDFGSALSLVLAGSVDNAIKDKLYRLAELNGVRRDRLIFTGYIDDASLVDLYRNAELFVFPSYSEGFGIPLLEAMAFGVAVVAANAASIPEIITDQSVLFDPHDENDLSKKIISILCDKRYKKDLMVRNRERAKAFSWKASAQLIYDKFVDICNTYSPNGLSDLSLDTFCSNVLLLDDFDRLSAAQSISDSFFSSRNRTLYLDVSALIHFDHATGIQRVVRSIMDYCLSNALDQWDVRPVFSYAGHKLFYHPHIIDGKVLLPDESELSDLKVDFNYGDTLVFLDLHPGSAISKRDCLVKLRSRGVKTVFVVYDLLPIEFPEFFVAELPKEFEEWLRVVANSDVALCISKDVKNKLSDWIETHLRKGDFNPLLEIDFFHLGADIESSSPSLGIPDNVDLLLGKLKEKKSFLMVGTVEPRKSHGFVLSAFEELWRQGQDVILIIAGRPGWRNESTIERIRNHQEFGDHLIWLDDVSDQYLDMLYEAVDAVISASVGEGFGLPLIEAAQKNIPIIARDIPVFREVAGEFAFYFDGQDPHHLADAICSWLELYEAGAHPCSHEMPWLTWDQSACWFLDVVIGSDRNLST